MTIKCTVSECERKVLARGLCQRHYNRVRRHGGVERLNVQRVDQCIIDGCENEAGARNLCVKHYRAAQPELKTTWKVLRSRYPDEFPPSWERFDNFAKDVGARPQDRSQLRRKDVSRMWSKENIYWTVPILKKDSYNKDERSEYNRAWHLKSRYDITPEQMDRVLARQGGGCAICGSVAGMSTRKDGKRARSVVDHVKGTKQIRGILDHACNTGIGLFNHDPARLRAAADYLEKGLVSWFECDEA